VTAPAFPVQNTERWNDAFAQAHDIDEYYTRASALIRWIERKRLVCIRSMISADPGDRILEVGCGGGHVLRLFPECRLTGVDVSGAMLRKAEANLCGLSATLLKGELFKLGLPDASFDRIICSEVLEHVVDPADLLREMRRLLHPTGRAVLTFPNDHLVNRLKSVLRRTGLAAWPAFGRISWGGDEYHLHVWTVNEMRNLLRESFTLVAERFAPGRFLPIRCCFTAVPNAR